MNILFQSRSNLLEIPGGDTIQLLKTKEYLEILGITVDISNELNPNLKDYDLVHIFNTTRIYDAHIQSLNAKSQNVPVALSSIYWNKDEYHEKGFFDTKSFFSFKYSSFIEFVTHFKSKQKLICNLADVILPNSNSEKDLMCNDFNIGSDKFHIVPNAIDEKIFNSGHGNFNYENNYSDFLLCVCRIEPRKNIHRLIQAINNTEIQLILVGENFNDSYFELCRKLSVDQNIIFLNPIPHHELPAAYAAAKVHILPSWFETPGLSSLEAAASGCSIVSTNRGSAYDYFGEMAHYCDPNNVKSIKDSIIQAFENPPSPDLKTEMLNKYTWTKTAEETLSGYKYALLKYNDK